jgi:DNA-binding CsgD family transcriptional regulator
MINYNVLGHERDSPHIMLDGYIPIYSSKELRIGELEGEHKTAEEIIEILKISAKELLEIKKCIRDKALEILKR